MAPPWKRLGIVLKDGEVGHGQLVEYVAAVARRHRLEVAVDRNAAAQTPALGESGHPQQEVIDFADLVVVLGGDGSVLAAVRAIGDRDVPILGINLGQLGFLTQIHPEEIESALERVALGRVRIVERSRLAVGVWRDAAEIERGVVLNDAVITKGSALARMIELEMRVDRHRVATFRSDGLIVSTPTGSTAYNLSAGGPVIEPDVSAVIVNPICPHTLSLRPLVLPDERRVEVELRSPEEATLTRDGQVATSLLPGDRVTLERAAHPARFVAVAEPDPFETLRTKLGWGSR